MIITLDRFSDHPSLRGIVSDRTHLEFNTRSKDFTFCEQIGDRNEYVRTPLSMQNITLNNMANNGIFREFATVNFLTIPWLDMTSFNFDIDEVAGLRKHLSADRFSDELNRRFA
jgi:hypothetical protein